MKRYIGINRYPKYIVPLAKPVQPPVRYWLPCFQQTEEYNTVLFSWHFKGFELLRRYFMKHPFGVDLEKLDLEELDKEMAADEAAQSSATETDAPENAPNTDGAVADT